MLTTERRKFAFEAEIKDLLPGTPSTFGLLLAGTAVMLLHMPVRVEMVLASFVFRFVSAFYSQT